MSGYFRWITSPTLNLGLHFIFSRHNRAFIAATVAPAFINCFL